MPRALKVCNVPGCPELTSGGRCAIHQRQADLARGTSAERGYGSRHRNRFRAGVLAKNPRCVCPDTGHGHGPECGQTSVHADHWPRDRRELVALRLDPDDPRYGRGMCPSCHSKHTVKEQPGGFNAR